MKGRILIIALSLVGVVTGQQSGAPVPFQWDRHKAERIDPKRTIEKSSLLTPDEKAALIDVVAARLRSFDVGSGQKLRKAAADMPINTVDLNGDGVPEVIAQAAGQFGCSPTGNCLLWVFQRKKDGYSVLLEAEAQAFRVQQTQANGFRDIVLSRHMSAFESEVRQYQFDGAEYKAGACYYFEWGDAEREFTQPHVKPCAQ